MHPLDLLGQSDRKDEMRTLLGKHGIANSWRLTPTLLRTGLDPVWLASQLSAKTLRDTLSREAIGEARGIEAGSLQGYLRQRLHWSLKPRIPD